MNTLKKTTMRQLFPLLFFAFFLIGNTNAQYSSQEMTNDRLHYFLTNQTPQLEGESGSWHFIYEDRIMMVVTDENVNRLRIFSIVIEEDALNNDQMRKMLEANFHSALDAKYSLFEGYVISVFTHPLKEIGASQLHDALLQVATLADNFGQSYSSSNAVSTNKKEKSPPQKEKKINQSPYRSR